MLRQRMKEQGVSYAEIAAVAGITRLGLIARLWGIRKWQLPEVIRVCCYFKTPNAEQLFLRNNNNTKFWKCQGDNYHV